MECLNYDVHNNWLLRQNESKYWYNIFVVKLSIEYFQWLNDEFIYLTKQTQKEENAHIIRLGSLSTQFHFSTNRIKGSINLYILWTFV